MPNETELRDRVIATAKTYLGTPYSKLDCSHFVEAVLRQFGVTLSPPSAGQAKFLYNKGLTFTDRNLLQIGDVIIWKNDKYVDRWRRIHHIAFYIGNGQLIESSGDDVHIRDIWETKAWPIIMYGSVIPLITKVPDAPAETEDEEMIVYFFQHAARAAGYKVLKDGATWKDAVTGENNGCDNSRGSWTQGVIKDVQKKHGLKQTGQIDGKTIAAVMSEVGDSGALAAAQAALKDLQDRVNNYAAGVKTAANMKI